MLAERRFVRGPALVRRQQHAKNAPNAALNKK
jgi:hypothetical protein